MEATRRAWILVAFAFTLALGIDARSNDSTYDEEPIGKEVITAVNEAFVPLVVQAGDQVWIVVQGLFSNACYRWSRAEVAPIGEFTRQIVTYAQVTQGICAMVLLPFQHEIFLGVLKPGVYVLQFPAGDGTYFEKTLSVQ